jgi:hypothetical protein
VAAVSWDQFETAYGAATMVPEQLVALVGSDEKRALHAAGKLDGMLCHQHVRADSAALPALPFLVEALDQVVESVAVEILNLIRGLAACVRWLSIERPSTFAASGWIADLDTALIDHETTWERIRKHSSPEVAEYADRILEALSAVEPPQLGID